MLDGDKVMFTEMQKKMLANLLKAGVYKQLAKNGLLTEEQLEHALDNNAKQRVKILKQSVDKFDSEQSALDWCKL